MMDLLRRNNKKILAVVGVFLMVAFIIPATYKSRAEREAMRVGKVGKTELTNTEYQEAQSAWNHLSTGGQVFGGFAAEIIAQRLAPRGLDLHPSWRLDAVRQARRIVSSLDTLSYMLLLHEAREAGVQVAPEVIQRWTNDEWYVWALAERVRAATPEPFERYQMFGYGRSEWQQAENGADPATHRQIIGDFLMVLEYFDRAGSISRVPPASALQQVARGRQRMAMEFVRFAPEDFLAQVGNFPEEKALQEMFTKYAAIDRTLSPDGIGFRLPNQYKLQYIEIRPADFRNIVSDDDVMKVWEAMPEPATQPATQPDDSATRPATQSATAPATTRAATKPALATAQASTKPAAATTQASTQPTTRKVLTVDIREQIRIQLCQEKALEMARVAQQFMAADWPAYRAWLKDPGAVPTYSVAAPYQDFAYFEALRNKLKKRDVMPRAGQIGEFKSLEDLWRPGLLGDTFTAEASAIRRPPFELFDDYLRKYFEPFAGEEDKRQATEDRVQLLQLNQPTPLFQDAEGNLYLMRVYEAQASRAAKSLDEVRDQVRAAYRQQQAYGLARKAAEDLVASAKVKGGLQQALNELPGSKFKIQVTQPFVQGFERPFPRAFGDMSMAMFQDPFLRSFPEGFPEMMPDRFPSPKLLELFTAQMITPAQETERQRLRRQVAQQRDRRIGSERAFALTDQAFDLYHKRLRTGEDRPMAVLESQAGGAVLAARLESAEPATEDSSLNPLVLGIEASLRGQLDAKAMEEWFSPNRISERTQFVPTERGERPAEQKKPSAPAPRPLGI